jgi:hypothetical protein
MRERAMDVPISPSLITGVTPFSVPAVPRGRE